MAETGGENGGVFALDCEGIVDLPGGSFSQLLLSDDTLGEATDYSNRQQPHSNDTNRKNVDGCDYFNQSPTTSSHVSPPVSATLFSVDTPKMLCFGGVYRNDGEVGSSQINARKPFTTSSRSTSSNKKRTNRSSEGKVSRGGSEDQVAGGEQRVGKKGRATTAGGRNGSRSRSSGHAKAARKEKLGERVTALQQLVSPYGKTDTASVLHEAMGYIRFLQDQVKVLCSPYLKHQQERFPSSSSPSSTVSSEGSDREFDKNGGKSLKSRGLCLVPVNCISHIVSTSNNGADFWSAAPASVIL